MPKKEWTKAQSLSHSTTRMVFIPADLVREIIPNADAKTIIGGKWTVIHSDDGQKALALKLKKFSSWPKGESPIE